MSSGSTGIPDQFSCNCKSADGNSQSFYNVPDCTKCTESCEGKDKTAISTCTPISNDIFNGISSGLLRIVIVTVVIIAVIVIGWFILWFFALKSTVNKFHSTNPKSKSGQVMQPIMVILFILAVILSIFHPFSGIAFLFFIILGIWFFRNRKKTKTIK
jgi:hypothetical protein